MTDNGSDGIAPTRYLANLVTASRWEDLPPIVVHEAKRSFLNWLGVAIGACRHETIQIAMRVVRDYGGPEQATILGLGRRTDVLHAAFVNGTSSHVFDFDDTHLATVIHPSGPVASALLALAEKNGRSGRELLHALVLGVEVECRIGNAIYPDHYDIGWHITSTTGALGSAAASSQLLGLNEDQTLMALGLAATQASGLREMFGSMAKPFHVGKAAQNGLLAAILASHGFTSSEHAIEAPRGFATVLSTKRDYREITDVPAGDYLILKNTYKPFACGIVIHPTIDACIQLRNRPGLNASDIAAVELEVHPLVLELTGKKAPKRGLEGKFSVYHSAAAALIDGAGGESQYSDERVLDPHVVALRQKVTATATAGLSEDEARVVVRMNDGKVHVLHVEHAIGSLGRPMSDAELEEKFRTVVDPVLPRANIDKLIDLCWTLDAMPQAAGVTAAAVPN